MNKNNLQKIFILLFLVVSSAYFVSCSDDDSPNNPSDNPTTNTLFGSSKVFTNGLPQSMRNYAVYDSLNTLVNTNFEYNTDNLLSKIVATSPAGHIEDTFQILFSYPKGASASHRPDSLTMQYISTDPDEDSNTFILKIGSNGFISEGKTNDGTYNFSITYNSDNQIKRIEVKNNLDDSESFFTMYSYKTDGDIKSSVTNYGSGASDFLFASYRLASDTTQTIQNTKQFPTQLFFTGDRDVLSQLSFSAVAGLLGYPTRNLPTSIIELESNNPMSFEQKISWESNSANNLTKLISKNNYDESFGTEFKWDK